MRRRDLIKWLSVGTASAAGVALFQNSSTNGVPEAISDGFFLEDIDATFGDMMQAVELMSSPAPDRDFYLDAFKDQSPLLAEQVYTQSPDKNSYLEKMANFDAGNRQDVYLETDLYPTLVSTYNRLDRLQKVVGHGNFNVISFDDALRYAARYSRVGEFTPQEQSFIDDLFQRQASGYGFYGEKVVDRLTATVPEKDRLKVRGSGHYLYRGASEALYNKIRRDVGETIILTSGIRSVVKQLHLFVAKTIQSEGNLSRASRSLAPPGHSYHGVGDFDVGKVGLGRQNFNEQFAKTNEFRRLVELGYVEIRYPKNNQFGVRFEPWHIKVA